MLAAGVCVLAAAMGLLVVTSPDAVITTLALVTVAATAWRWPQVVPAMLLAGPGFIHLLTATAAGGATRGDVLASPITFLPVLAVLFGPPAWRGLVEGGGLSRRASLRPGTAGRWLMIGIVILLVLLVVRYPGSPSPVYGLTKIGGFAAYSVFPVVLIFIAFRSESDSRKIMDALLIIGASWLLVSLSIAISQGDLDLYRANPGELLGGGNQAAGGLGGRAVSVALVALASATRASRWRIARVAVGMLGIAVLLLSGHRGSILSFVCGLVVLLLLTYRRIQFRQVLSGTIALAAVALMSWWTLQHAPQDVLQRYEDPLASQSVADRLDDQRLVLAGWRGSPIIGHGTGASAFLGTSLDQTGFGVVGGIYPHNVTVELLGELGLIGAGAYLLTVWGTVIKAIRGRSRDEGGHHWALTAAAACSVAAFVSSQTGSDLTIQNDLWIFLAILAIAVVPVVPTLRTGQSRKPVLDG